MRRSRAARAALPTLVVLLAAGCGSTASDKAGGAVAPSATVLTMANGNGLPNELQFFAEAAERLSGGTLQIAFENEWRGGMPGYETGAIDDVRAGKADLAWAGTRAFDDVGVPAFAALHAPLLIDSYPLEATALESPLVREMLRGLAPLGVVGLGILPGPMRKPLGMTRLVRPADYAGKTFAFQRSEVAEATFRALGARGAEIPSAGAIDEYDGIEQQVSSIDNNHYDGVAKHLTANVNLWPRPLVVFVNVGVFDALDARQRSALREAARAALPATLARLQADEKEGAANLCRRGVDFVTATAGDVAALRRSVQRVYDRLERDAATKAAIAQLLAMRSEAAAAPDAPTCPGPGGEADAAGRVTPIDGRYTVRTTAKELLAAGSPDAPAYNYGTFEMTLDRGRFTQRQPLGYTAVGTYTVAGDTVTLTYTSGAGGPGANRAGETFDYRWSLYRDQLTFAAVAGKVSPETFRAKPWRRLGDAE